MNTTQLRDRLDALEDTYDLAVQMVVDGKLVEGEVTAVIHETQREVTVPPFDNVRSARVIIVVNR